MDATTTIIRRPRGVVLDEAWTKHKELVTLLRKQRATLHQLITHPESDTLPDGDVLERLAQYRGSVQSCITLTERLRDAHDTPGRSYAHGMRVDALARLAVDLRKGTF